MGIRVVTSASAPRTGIQPWRAARAVLGWVLVLGGLLVAVPMVGLIVAFTLSRSPTSELGTMLLIGGVGAGAVAIGRWLVRGKRRLVLFLRRFGFTGSSRALSFAVGTAVGRRFRAVTLDDAELAPLGTRRWVRWLLTVASVVSVFLLILIARGVIQWFAGDALGEVFTRTFESTRTAAVQRGDNPVGAFIGGLIAAIFIAMIIGIMTLSLFTVFFAVVGSSAAVSASSWVGVIRAEFAKRTTVRQRGEIERAAIHIAERARGIFAPKLVVLSSASGVWREMVQRLAAVADVLLIDVSVPSDNLLWEISILKAEHSQRWILIGQSDKVAALVDRADVAADGATTQLADLLDGQEILTYATDSRKALRRFTRALRASCERITAPAD